MLWNCQLSLPACFLVSGISSNTVHHICSTPCTTSFRFSNSLLSFYINLKMTEALSQICSISSQLHHSDEIADQDYDIQTHDLLTQLRQIIPTVSDIRSDSPDFLDVSKFYQHQTHQEWIWQRADGCIIRISTHHFTHFHTCSYGATTSVPFEVKLVILFQKTYALEGIYGQRPYIS